MTARLLEGKSLASTLGEETAAGVRDLVARGGRRPGLTAVLVGENPASQVYVASKTRGCEAAGMIGRTLALPAATGEAELRRLLDQLNDDEAVDGILVQLPLPKGLPERDILDLVAPEKDVDGFHPQNVGNLWLDRPAFHPATPAGVMELLRRQEIPLAGRHAVIVGRSAIVGKPMAALLLREHCTVTICHSRTRDLAAITRQADILVAAIGRPAALGETHVKEGAVVIDVGINRVSDAAEVERLFPGDPGRRRTLETKGAILVGDVDFTRVREKAAAITPVPGGVGLLTVAMVIANTLTASRRRQGL